MIGKYLADDFDTGKTVVIQILVIRGGIKVEGFPLLVKGTRQKKKNKEGRRSEI